MRGMLTDPVIAQASGRGVHQPGVGLDAVGLAVAAVGDRDGECGAGAGCRRAAVAAVEGGRPAAAFGNAGAFGGGTGQAGNRGSAAVGPADAAAGDGGDDGPALLQRQPEHGLVAGLQVVAKCAQPPQRRVHHPWEGEHRQGGCDHDDEDQLDQREAGRRVRRLGHQMPVAVKFTATVGLVPTAADVPAWRTTQVVEVVSTVRAAVSML
mmetsp:Transcript_53126/g.124258  ORF Transcript_53126/g.124258 Transcript_53126/m.124258 type:complete len:209 (-) Transcript_53126:962-1588(-)